MGVKSSLFAAVLMAGSALAATATSSSSSSSSTTSVEPIIMKGQKFFYKNGTQFFIKGVAYQQDPSSEDYIDPLSDSTLCERDIPLLAELQTNVIRTYAIDPTADHDACMALLQEYGIYVISDLSEPDVSINRDDPTWNTELYTRYKNVVDALAGYDNVIGFFAGNEVTNNASNTDASAYVKAAVRDMKAYINSTYDRWMGVGYAANDDSEIRDNMAYYFNCGEQAHAIDYWGYNIYEWCGENTFTGSGYSKVVDFFSNYSVPVFFAEYGCNTPDGAEGRIWEETTALYSSEMTDVIAGGIVYMYFQEDNDYGLVTIDGSSASTMSDFSRLSTRMASVDPSSTSYADYTPTNVAQSCPSVNSDWAASDILPPTPSNETCDCMYKSLTCVLSSSANTSDYSSLFGSICGLDSDACVGITANTTTGVYGAYVMCDSDYQLAYALNQYYLNQDSSSSACDWDGMASTVTAASTASSCTAILEAAASTNSYAATATAGVSSSGTDSSSSSSSTGSTSAGITNSPQSVISFGSLSVGLYALAAMLTGVGMIML